jgi:hypothetical protein
VPFSLPSFFWACKRKKGAAAHPPLSNGVRADARMKINHRVAIHKKAGYAVTRENHSLTAMATV